VKAIQEEFLIVCFGFKREGSKCYCVVRLYFAKGYGYNQIPIFPNNWVSFMLMGLFILVGYFIQWFAGTEANERREDILGRILEAKEDFPDENVMDLYFC